MEEAWINPVDLTEASESLPPVAERFLRYAAVDTQSDETLSLIHISRALTDNERALAAIDRLENVYGILEIYGLSSYVTFDLGMLSKYQYYTCLLYTSSCV